MYNWNTAFSKLTVHVVLSHRHDVEKIAFPTEEDFSILSWPAEGEPFDDKRL
jgi:hypothetical protein